MLNLAASSPPIQISSSNELLDQNGFVSTTSLTLSKPKPSPGSFQQILDSSHDEGLMILQSPKVCFFFPTKHIHTFLLDLFLTLFHLWRLDSLGDPEP